ncbi:hypothetical protein NIES4103_31340 [Nostoc sp. NIES-4103]|nr:hypothetical protein NIES4103_31340 [Nostoc sp. NIES-4103]
MSSITTFNQSRAFTIKLDSTNGSNIIPLFDISPYTSNSGDIIAENVFIKNLKAYAKISSLDPIQLPDIGVEDSDLQRTYKVLNVEWGSPRKQINLFLREAPTGQWNPFGSISLLNPSGYPYRMYSLQDIFTDNLAIELGSNGQIGVQIQDVGYGVLSGADVVTICGTYIKEIVLQTPAKINSTTPFAVVVGESKPILTANNNRKYVALTNPGDNPAWINLGSTATLNQGIYLAGKGGSFDFSVVDVPYFGVISAISSGNTEITGVEST